MVTISWGRDTDEDNDDNDNNGDSIIFSSSEDMQI